MPYPSSSLYPGPLSAEEDGIPPIPGLEAVHVWDSAIGLNYLDDFPRFKVRKITGLKSRPEADDLREAAQGRMGEVFFTSFLRGKTIVYEGEIQALNLNDLRVADDAFRAAVASTEEKQMVISYDSGYGPGMAGSFFYWARPTQLEIPEEQTVGGNHVPSPWIRPFVFGVRMSDPRFYFTQEVSDETGPLDVVGGITPPITPPITIEVTATGGSVTVTNEGTAPADPIIDIYGPCTNPEIINNSTGKRLVFSDGFVLAEDEFVRVDFRNRRILLMGDSDVYAKLDVPSSDWWDEGVAGLEPGSNTVLMRGEVAVDPSHAIVTFNPAFY